MTFKEANEKYEDEFLKFDRIANKRSSRPDIHAFILLNEIYPGNWDMVSAAEHDEIWLEVPLDALDKNATEEQMVELIRCGVRLDEYHEALAMFV